jgi:tyrosyl-tRNA synthetase
VPQFRFKRELLSQNIKASDFLTDNCPVFFSKSEARKMMQGGGVSINKEKTYDHSRPFTEADLVDDRYIVLQRGKKNYYLLVAE